MGLFSNMWKSGYFSNLYHNRPYQSEESSYSWIRGIHSKLIYPKHLCRTRHKYLCQECYTSVAFLSQKYSTWNCCRHFYCSHNKFCSFLWSLQQVLNQVICESEIKMAPSTILLEQSIIFELNYHTKINVHSFLFYVSSPSVMSTGQQQGQNKNPGERNDNDAKLKSSFWIGTCKLFVQWCLLDPFRHPLLKRLGRRQWCQ